MMPTAVARAYLLVWAACHLVYPLWLLPKTAAAAALSYAAFCLAFWCLYRYLRPALFAQALFWSPQGGRSVRSALPADPALWTILGVDRKSALFPCLFS